MALSRVTTWSVGQVLTASALNGEFNNILDNALSLITPLTGGLDVNSNSLTNVNEVHFANSAADATAAGRLRRNATVLSWHNGTTAADVITEHTFTAKGTILTASAASTAVLLSPGTDGRVLRTNAAEANGIAYGAQGGYIHGLVISNNGSDATNDIDIAVGECSSTGTTYADRAVMALTTAITKRLDANWAVGTNQGGLDTGSIANDTYHVFLIMRSDTGVVDALFSTSPTSPTMPANYDFKRRIGSIVRVGATILAFSQDGDTFLLSASQAVDAANPGTSAVSRALGIPTDVKFEAIITPAVLGGTTSNIIHYVSSLDQADEQPSATTGALTAARPGTIEANAAGTWCFGGIARVRTDTSAQVRSRLSASGAADRIGIMVYGWVDTRGKNA